MRCMSPAIVPVHYALLYMIQSKGYIFAPDFVAYNKKVDFSETEVLWRLVHFPEEANINMIMKLVFDPRSYGKKVSLPFIHINYSDLHIFCIRRLIRGTTWHSILQRFRMKMTKTAWRCDNPCLLYLQLSKQRQWPTQAPVVAAQTA